MKMMKKKTYIVTNVLLMLTLCLTVPAFAESVQKQIDIKLYVDGTPITAQSTTGVLLEPFVVDGVVYVPAYAIANAVNKTYEWDGVTGSLYIGSRPGATQYMTDVLPAYQSSGDYREYSALKSGGTESYNMGGIKYTDGMILSGRDTWAVWNMNGQYSSLSGVLCHVDGGNGIIWEGSAIQVFCDGVLRDEFPVSSDMAPRQIHIDLRGVNQLKIVANSQIIVGEFGVGNPVLQ